MSAKDDSNTDHLLAVPREVARSPSRSSSLEVLYTRSRPPSPDPAITCYVFAEAELSHGKADKGLGIFKPGMFQMLRPQRRRGSSIELTTHMGTPRLSTSRGSKDLVKPQPIHMITIPSFVHESDLAIGDQTALKCETPDHEEDEYEELDEATVEASKIAKRLSQEARDYL